MDTTLPRQFIELSLHSLKHGPDQALQLNQQPGQQFNSIDVRDQTLRLKPEPLPLKPLHEENIVAAIDTSTMKIGETSTGIVIAIRGANVWKQHRRYRYMRFGPFIFHVTEENKKQVYETLERTYSSSLHEHCHQGAPRPSMMPRPMTAIFVKSQPAINGACVGCSIPSQRLSMIG